MCVKMIVCVYVLEFAYVLLSVFVCGRIDFGSVVYTNLEANTFEGGDIVLGCAYHTINMVGVSAGLCVCECVRICVCLCAGVCVCVCV